MLEAYGVFTLKIVNIMNCSLFTLCQYSNSHKNHFNQFDSIMKY